MTGDGDCSMSRHWRSNARLLPVLRVILLINLGAFGFGMLRLLVDKSDSVESAATQQLSKELKACAQATSGSMQSQRANCSQHTTESLTSNITKLTNSSVYRIPNIVHYVWFNQETAPLKFYHMLCILSAHKVLKPEVIYFHTNREPGGPYWEQVKMLPTLRVTYREPPVELFGEKVKEPMFYTSHSNVDRVKILMEYGGIYLDLDMLVVKPFDELRKHSCVIGMESATKACGSVILCEKTSFFLILWINAYLDDYRMSEWAYNTGQVPANLARRFPHLAHVERARLNRPNFEELDKLWGPNTFDWKNNYAVHTWYRIWKDMSPYYNGIDLDPWTIKSMNNTFGEMARSIYYGSPNLFTEQY